MGYSFIAFTILSGLLFQAGLFAVGVACGVIAFSLGFAVVLMYMDGKF